MLDMISEIDEEGIYRYASRLLKMCWVMNRMIYGDNHLWIMFILKIMRGLKRR